MANVTGQFRTVQRVEMQRVDAFFKKITAEFGAKRRGKQVFATIADGCFECGLYPFGDYGTAGPSELGRAFPILNRQDAGNDRLVDACFDTCVAEAKESLGLEEELGECFVSACV